MRFVSEAQTAQADSEMGEVVAAAIFRRAKRSTIVPDERESAEAYDQMCCLDQPVQITHQDHLLRNAKNGHDERVDNPYGSQSSQPAAENRYHCQDQQYEDNDETKQHMDICEIHVGIRAQAQCHRYQRGDCGYYLQKTCSIHGKVMPFFHTMSATRPSLPGGRLVNTKMSGISVGAGVYAISFQTQILDG